MYIQAKDKRPQIDVEYIMKEFLGSPHKSLNKVGRFMEKVLRNSQLHLTQEKRVCKCGKMFMPTGNNQRFHNEKCRKRYQNEKTIRQYAAKKAAALALKEQRRNEIIEFANTKPEKTKEFLLHKASRTHSPEDNPFT